MEILLIGAVALAFVAACLAIAVFSTGLGQKTCRECGRGLPTNRLSSRPAVLALGDWTCPKCGTRFDRQGRARDPLPT
jgi:ribosomal protein L37AE/L43A